MFSALSPHSSTDPSHFKQNRRTTFSRLPTGAALFAALATLSLLPVAQDVQQLMAAMYASDPGALGQHWMGVRIMPEPVIVHVAANALFLLLGAVQFTGVLRGASAVKHALVGTAIFASGQVAALSAVWNALVYPLAPLATSVSNGMTFWFGWAMALFLMIGLLALLLDRIETHRAFMIRAYALALGPSTHALLSGLAWLALGNLTPGLITLSVALGRAINCVIAELVIGHIDQRTAVARRTLVQQ